MRLNYLQQVYVLSSLKYRPLCHFVYRLGNTVEADLKSNTSQDRKIRIEEDKFYVVMIVKCIGVIIY